MYTVDQFIYINLATGTVLSREDFENLIGKRGSADNNCRQCFEDHNIGQSLGRGAYGWLIS